MNRKALISSTEGARQRLALLKEDFQSYLQLLKDSGMVASAGLIESRIEELDRFLLEIEFTINQDNQKTDIVRVACEAAVHGNPISESSFDRVFERDMGPE